MRKVRETVWICRLISLLLEKTDQLAYPHSECVLPVVSLLTYLRASGISRMFCDMSSVLSGERIIY